MRLTLHNSTCSHQWARCARKDSVHARRDAGLSQLDRLGSAPSTGDQAMTTARSASQESGTTANGDRVIGELVIGDGHDIGLREQPPGLRPSSGLAERLAGIRQEDDPLARLERPHVDPVPILLGQDPPMVVLSPLRMKSEYYP